MAIVLNMETISQDLTEEQKKEDGKLGIVNENFDESCLDLEGGPEDVGCKECPFLDGQSASNRDERYIHVAEKDQRDKELDESFRSERVKSKVNRVHDKVKQKRNDVDMRIKDAKAGDKDCEARKTHGAPSETVPDENIQDLPKSVGKFSYF